MDPITAFTLLSNVVPEVLHLLGHDTAANTAQKVVDMAKVVTGKQSPDEAVAAIQADPNLALQLQKAIIDEKVRLADIDAKAKADAAAADNEADSQLTKRMNDYEGTASDLKSLPVLGPIMLFMRGMQRLVISYGTTYLDYLWLTGGLGALPDLQQRLLFTASLLVFVVLFGERAIQNVAPLLTDLLAARNGK